METAKLFSYSDEGAGVRRHRDNNGEIGGGVVSRDRAVETIERGFVGGAGGAADGVEGEVGEVVGEGGQGGEIDYLVLELFLHAFGGGDLG